MGPIVGGLPVRWVVYGCARNAPAGFACPQSRGEDRTYLSCSLVVLLAISHPLVSQRSACTFRLKAGGCYPVYSGQYCSANQSSKAARFLFRKSNPEEVQTVEVAFSTVTSDIFCVALCSLRRVAPHHHQQALRKLSRQVRPYLPKKTFLAAQA